MGTYFISVVSEMRPSIFKTLDTKYVGPCACVLLFSEYMPNIYIIGSKIPLAPKIAFSYTAYTSQYVKYLNQIK